MAVKFFHIFIVSATSALVLSILFYIMSAAREAVFKSYTATDTYLGSVFVFLMVFIIGLSLWPGILEKKR